MNESRLRRCQQEMAEIVGGPRAGSTHRRPQGHPQIRLPGFAAKLSPLDLEGLLPPKILRLLIHQDFRRVASSVDGPQFCQTITSFSSWTPYAQRTRSRSSSISFNMSE